MGWKKEVSSASLAARRGTVETRSKQLKGDLGVPDSKKVIHVMVALYVEGVPVTKGKIGVGKLVVVSVCFLMLWRAGRGWRRRSKCGAIRTILKSL